MQKILYERDLFEPLRQHLADQGFDIRSEVRSCDLVAKKDDLLIVVEMKRHLSFDLLAQAVERQAYADAVYICVPKSPEFKQDKKYRARLKVLRQLGLGLLIVSKTELGFFVEEALTPDQIKPVRPSAKKKQALEQEFRNRLLDLNIAGSRGVPLVTAYREAALFVAFLISIHGPQTAKSLRNLGSHPKKTTAILNINYYAWFVKQPDLLFALTDAGIEALNTYKPLVEAFAAASVTKSIENI